MLVLGARAWSPPPRSLSPGSDVQDQKRPMISPTATSQLACVERCFPDSDRQLRAVPLPSREFAKGNIIPPGRAGW